MLGWTIPWGAGTGERCRQVRAINDDGADASDIASPYAIGYPTAFGHPHVRDDLRKLTNDRSMPDMIVRANDALHAINVSVSRGVDNIAHDKSIKADERDGADASDVALIASTACCAEGALLIDVMSEPITCGTGGTHAHLDACDDQHQRHNEALRGRCSHNERHRIVFMRHCEADALIMS